MRFACTCGAHKTPAEMAATRARWIAAGEVWPYPDVAPLPIPLPPQEFV